MSHFRNLLVVPLALVALYSLSPITYSQSRSHNWICVKLGDYGCLGKARFVVKKAFSRDTVGTYAFSSFSNGEFLFEDLSNTNTKKLLLLPRANKYLFSGVNGREEAEGLERRFQHEVGGVVFGTLVTLVGAFPEGENGFPDKWQNRRLETQGQVSDISGRQAGHNRFFFQVQNRDWDIEGEWDTTKPDPWADSESMAGWTVWGVSPSPTLGQVRKAARE